RNFDSYFNKINLDISSIDRLEEVPFIPARAFKIFDLTTCDHGDIVRSITSSSTTGKTPSRVPLNKATSLRQTRGLMTTLNSYLGKKRRPFLVIDTEDVNKAGLANLTARGAAIRGLSPFAKSIHYLLKNEEDEIIVDFDLVKKLSEQYRDQKVYIFGFTFIIWSIFYERMIEAGQKLRFKDVRLLHSGGWKKLSSRQVSKEIFNDKISDLLSTRPGNIIDFYGMAEQTGVIFPDCEYQNKHVPDFAEVIIRDPLSLKECAIGKTGLIEVMSILSDSYYSQAIITEDLGVLIGVDDCPCGRKGKYFRFVSRVEEAEIRGCGDTFI
ncbi:MAG: acyl-protein synthetase, partial [Candidatus Auribacterota bacterium]|nr:acyl-protein synthetase [Candidatus Auribacterota bacterium]